MDTSELPLRQPARNAHVSKSNFSGILHSCVVIIMTNMLCEFDTVKSNIYLRMTYIATCVNMLL